MKSAVRVLPVPETTLNQIPATIWSGWIAAMTISVPAAAAISSAFPVKTPRTVCGNSATKSRNGETMTRASTAMRRPSS